MLPIILLAIAVPVGGVLAYAATKPKTFRVERRRRINARPETIFAFLNDFHRWPDWSPWEKLDPAMNRAHSGAPSGKGAVYDWEGNKKVGKGRMEITASKPSSALTIQLDFLKPFEAHNTTEFTLEPDGDATNVTWAMHGPATYVTKVMTVFMSMDKMVGKDFEAGLDNLQALAEKR